MFGAISFQMLSVSNLYQYISLACAQSILSGRMPVFTWVKGDLYLRNQQHTTAITLYQTGLERNGAHPLAASYRLKLGTALFHERKILDAEKELLKLLSIEPAHTSALTHLVKIYRWCGRDLEAAWLLHNSAKSSPLTEELQALFCLSVFDSGEDALWSDAEEIVSQFSLQTLNALRPQLALARYEQVMGRQGRSLDILMHILRMPIPHPDAAVYASQICIKEQKFDQAKELLTQILKVVPDHPRSNSLFAELYLKSGENFNATFALQLALNSCKASGWISVREMRILAEAYYHAGEKFSALLVARRAKNVAESLVDNRELTQALDHLIESLDIAI